jgi:hypothetical protein
VDKRRSLLAIPSTDGLGAVLEPPPLRSWPSQTDETLQRDTFVFDCTIRPPDLQATTEATPAADCGQQGRAALYFTSGSVPEPIRVRHQSSDQYLALRTVAGERPAEGRAATTGLALWLPCVPTVEQPTEVAVLYSSEVPTRSSDLAGERVVRIAFALAGGGDELLMAYLYCPQRSSAPNV